MGLVGVLTISHQIPITEFVSLDVEVEKTKFRSAKYIDQKMIYVTAKENGLKEGESGQLYNYNKVSNMILLN